jgi:hypothetical protein
MKYYKIKSRTITGFPARTIIFRDRDAIIIIRMYLIPKYRLNEFDPCNIMRKFKNKYLIRSRIILAKETFYAVVRKGLELLEQ